MIYAGNARACAVGGRRVYPDDMHIWTATSQT